MRFIRNVLIILSLSLNAHAQTSIWVVSKGEDHILLGGTIHLLRDRDFPLPPAYERAYQASDRVFFETDLEAAKAPQFGQRLLNEMSLPAGITVADELDDRTLDKLASFAESRQFPLQAYLAMEPAMVALLLTLNEYARFGFGEGVEGFYLKRTLQDGKDTGFLETTDEQLRALTALKNVDANALIEYTLEDIEQMREFVDDMVQHWRTGTLDKLQSKYFDEMRAGFPKVYRTLIDDRNLNWIPKLVALFDNAEKEFVLVGALHLTGPNSVLDLLRREGYEIRRY